MFDYLVYSDTTYQTATSYISTDEYINYALKNIFIEHSGVETEDELYLQDLLVNATFVLENLVKFSGIKFDYDQNLEFPRSYELERIINKKVKLATAYIASQIKKGNSSSFFVSNEDSYVKKQKIDVLEVEYEKAQSKSDILFNTHPLLRELLSDYMGGSCINVKTCRV